MNELYYDEKYFEWQRQVGEFGGKANLFKFEKYIGANSDVLDFGCGGGYLLKNVETTGRKIGVEINPVAREMAKQNGIDNVVDSIKKIDDNSIDVLISNHALEHVDNPVGYINEFKRVVRSGGKIVIVVPHEVSEVVNKDDINMHLYTWSPQCLYNLLFTCGIEEISCERLCHAWMPGYIKVQKKVGWKNFHKLCSLYSKKKKIYQTVAIGLVK